MKKFLSDLWRNQANIIQPVLAILVLTVLAWIYAGFVADGSLEGCSGHMTIGGYVAETCIDGNTYLHSMKSGALSPKLDNDGRPVSCN